MNKKYIIIIVALSIALLWVYCMKSNNTQSNDTQLENFSNNQAQIKKNMANTNFLDGYNPIAATKKPAFSENNNNLGLFNLGREKPVSNTYEDKLFTDMITYENDPDGGQIGLDKCLAECQGNCLEFGQTGLAWCFPGSKGETPPNYIENLRDSSDLTENIDEKPDKLIFANMR